MKKLVWAVLFFLVVTRAMASCDVEAPAAKDSLIEVGKPTNAVILVGGIGNNYNYFSSWVSALKQPDTIVLGFNHDHKSSTMADAADRLTQDIVELQKQGIVNVKILAHSMGGLVAKAAVNRLVKIPEFTCFHNVELHAFGTPWGGFALADLVIVLPFKKSISEKIGLPMGPEMGPHSEFMETLNQSWPDNVRLYVYLGTADKIATPAMQITKTRYQDNTKNAVIYTVNHIDHDGYSRLRPSSLIASFASATL